jgi:hypothetical protein
MAITTLASVKTVARLFDRSGSGAPTTATVGELGEIYMNTATGLTYYLATITTTPSTAYNWVADTAKDAQINLYIPRAEADYLAIRGVAFETEDDEPVYPSGASVCAAEMVCYLTGIGRFDGRGKSSESLSSRQAQYDAKIKGYPMSIVGTIERYQSAL